MQYFLAAIRLMYHKKLESNGRDNCYNKTDYTTALEAFHNAIKEV